MPLVRFNCSNKFLAILRKESPAGIRYKAIYTTCKTWKCPECSERNVYQLRNIIYRHFKDRNIWHITFTIKNYGQSSAVSRKHIKLSFDKFRKRMKRKFKNFDYVLFCEFTKKGIAHYHLLTSQRLCHAFLKSNWLECTGNSWVVYIKRYKASKSTIKNYVSKYVSKQCINNQSSTLYGHRFVCYTRHFYKLAKIINGWKLIKWIDTEANTFFEIYKECQDIIIEMTDNIRGSPKLYSVDGFDFSDCIVSFF